MKSKAIAIFLLAICFLAPNTVLAESGFATSADVTYEVSQEGQTQVSYAITITNKTSDIYPTSYVLALSNSEVSELAAHDDTGPLKASINKTEGSVDIRVDLSESPAGKAKSKSFSIDYLDSKITQRTGEIWEITIPKVDAGSFDNYTVDLKVPAALGKHAYMTPDATDVTADDETLSYRFDKSKLENSGITASFGEYQVFNLNLTYHLFNDARVDKVQKITLPPDTNLQRIYLNSIDPTPQDVTIDADGNWLASYTLAAKQRLDVSANLTVQTFPSPIKSFANNVLNQNVYTKSTEYWQTDAEPIKLLAQSLTSPRAIYDYVVDNLDYDFTKVATQAKRLGALGALHNPSSAICTEFTDLFVALARAAGIPAREVNGYAYTENPDIQPLSLVSDVLHAWPEYWDADRGTWIAVDPTWEATSGVDFFSHLGLRHIAFVIHGEDDSRPLPAGSYKLGENPQKDVFVSFAQIPPAARSELALDAELKNKLWPISKTLVIDIANLGNTASYNTTLNLYLEDQLYKTYDIGAIPPIGHSQIELDINYGLLAKNAPSEIKVELSTGATKSLTTQKQRFAIFQLILLLVVLMLVLINTVLKNFQRKLSRFIFGMK